MTTILTDRAVPPLPACWPPQGRARLVVHPLLELEGLPSVLLECDSFQEAYRLAGDPYTLAEVLQSPAGPDFQRWAHRQPHPERALRLAVAVVAATQAGLMGFETARARLAAPLAPRHRTVSLETLRDLPAAALHSRYEPEEVCSLGDFAGQLFADAVGVFASAVDYTPTGSAVEALTVRWQVVWSVMASPEGTQKGVVTVGVSQRDAGRAARRARHHLPATPGLSRSRTVAADRLLLGSTGGAPSWLAACARSRDSAVVSRWAATWAADMLRCDAAHDQLPATLRANAERRVRRAVSSRTNSSGAKPRWVTPLVSQSLTPARSQGLSLAS